MIGRLLDALRTPSGPSPRPSVPEPSAAGPSAVERIFVAHTPLLSAGAWRSQLDAAPGRVAAWAASAAASKAGAGPAAQTAWGRLLLAGEGVERDPEAALRCFRRAAEAGHAEAANMVGRCHERGWGVPADPARAVPWYRRAAEAGDAWAQFNLANLLFDGQGVAADWREARRWYLRAGRRRHAKAMNMLGRYCEEGWSGAPRPVAAFHWYRRAAGGGDFRAQFNYGRLLFGIGRRDEALRWLEASIDHGIPVFCRNAAAELDRSADPALRALGRRARAQASKAVCGAVATVSQSDARVSMPD